jgi:hypothetical protein
VRVNHECWNEHQKEFLFEIIGEAVSITVGGSQKLSLSFDCANENPEESNREENTGDPHIN